MRHFVLVLGISVLVSTPALAQMADASANPLTASAKGTYETVRRYIVKSAEKVPESEFAFKPTPEVRSFGAILGHVANANFMMCARAAGEKSPATEDIEKTKTSKADLVKALNDAFAYCDKVYAGMNDAKGAQMVDFMRGKQPGLGVLNFNNSHNFEHYGNLVTYMRLKGIVPPSSEGSGM